MKYNRSSLLSLENNYRHANGGAKLLTIRKLKSAYNINYINIIYIHHKELRRKEFSNITEEGFPIDY